MKRPLKIIYIDLKETLESALDNLSCIEASEEAFSVFQSLHTLRTQLEDLKERAESETFDHEDDEAQI